MSAQKRHAGGGETEEQRTGQSGGVLVLSAMYGDGHRRAAQAVGLALDDRTSPVPHWERDYFDFVDRRFNRLVARTYVLSVRHAPKLWEAFYRGTAAIRPDSPMQRYLNGLGRRRLLQEIRRSAPGAVLNTFPTPVGVISTLKRRGRLSLPNLAVVTDYAVHSQWIHPGVDRYYVGSESVRQGLLGRGVPDEAIRITGIPVHPRFIGLPGAAEARRAIGLPERPTVLAMAGAYGMMGGFREMLQRLVALDLDCEILAIAGRDADLKTALESIPAGGRTGLRVYGYVTEIHELYAACDVVLGKAGGLTVSEALATGRPMLIYRPIPGQEEFNTEFVASGGAGLHARSEEELLEAFRRVVDDESLRSDMAQRARQLARPNAANAIAEDVATWLAR